MTETISTKAQSIELASQGKFGNTFPIWKSIEALYASGYPGPVMLRYNIPGHQTFNRDAVPLDELEIVVAEWIRQGAIRSLITATVAGTCGKRLLNAEVMRSDDPLAYGYVLYYSTVNAVMRRSLQEGGRYATGVRALLLLRSYLDPASYEDLQDLWNRWPNSVVELTVFNQNVGDRPHRNTVFWEVRDY